MTILHLFRPNGQPSTTTDDHDFLKEMFRYDREELSEAMLVFTGGMLADDPVATYAGVQKLASVTALMQDRARDWARGRA